MSFYDIGPFNYDRFVRASKNKAPYRGSGNAYPLGDRKYSGRHFRAEEDGSFSVWYADRETVDNKYKGRNDKADRLERHGDYYHRQKLGIVRPDNTFEFINRIGQGEGALLSNLLHSYIHHVKAKGGNVFEKTDRHNKTGHVHPIFNGLRVDCDSGEAKTPYEVSLLKVKRKTANLIMSQYTEFFNVFEAMAKSMDNKGISSVYADLFTVDAESDKEKWRGLNMLHVKKMIDEKRYLDAACLFTATSAQTGLRWRVEWQIESHQSLGHSDIPEIQVGQGWLNHTMRDLATNFRRAILKEHPEAFDFVPIAPGTGLPSTQWGLHITHNGQVVNRL